jgi:hypothetical protein
MSVLRETLSSVVNGKPHIRGINFSWYNHLDPMVKKTPWNETEQLVFIESHKIHGNKWAEISRILPGR